MCVPSPPPVPAAPAVAVPSIASANNLELGGASRGAAQIGRLALRLGSPNSAGQDQTGAPAPPNPVTNSTTTGGAATLPQASTGDQALIGTAGYSNNSSLRLGGGVSRS